METEGRGFSELYRNSSEELFLKTMMESPIGMPPTLEMLGFKSASQNLRTDSEELFKRWLTNGEASSFIMSFICKLQVHGGLSSDMKATSVDGTICTTEQAKSLHSLVFDFLAEQLI